MSFSLTLNQLEIRDSIRSFLTAEFPESYIKTRVASEIKFDQATWNQLLSFGFHEAFSTNNGVDSWAEVELWVVAVEVGRALVPEPLVGDLLVKSFLAPYLNLQTWIKPDVLTQLQIVKDSAITKVEDQLWRLDYLDAVVVGQTILLMQEGPHENILFLLPSEEYVCENYSHTGDIIFSKSKISFNPQAVKSVQLTAEQFQLIAGWYYLYNSAQQLGLAEKIFEGVLDYANLRKQFGVPIASFQVIQQRFAELYLILQALQALSLFAAQAAAKKQEQFYFSAMSALVYANQNVVSLIESSLQIYGGIGFTWDHTLHLYLRRALSLRSGQESFSENLVDFIKKREGACCQ